MTEPGGPHLRRGSLETRSPLIGLIGPIGCGKSTVARWLADRGAAVVDADRLTRELMSPGAPVTEAVIARFGAEYRRGDGSLDRAALGRLVFADPACLADLESIVHPAVARVAPDAIRAADATGPVAIVLEAIKLVEVGHAAWCDEIWLVVCDPATQLARLTGRGMSESDARQRIDTQAISLPLWRSAATRVLSTDGTSEEVEQAVDAALREALAAHAGRAEPS
ncbi:MAG: dephospho-CoA kinase [Candidatus Limnocylindrales bacterium]